MGKRRGSPQPTALLGRKRGGGSKLKPDKRSAPVEDVLKVAAISALSAVTTVVQDSFVGASFSSIDNRVSKNNCTVSEELTPASSNTSQTTQRLHEGGANSSRVEATESTAAPEKSASPAGEILSDQQVGEGEGNQKQLHGTCGMTTAMAAANADSEEDDRVNGDDTEDTRTTGEEEDELSEVEPDAVPPEVREWLASTFTRQLTNNRRKTDEKPRFRSVANAIRAGIFVERIYRRLSSATFLQLPPEVTRLLKKVDEWHFDVWQLQEISNNTPLRCLAYELLNRYGLLHKFKVPPAALEAFLTQVEAGYCKYKNPYHNNVHAADVMQTIHFMLSQTGLINWLSDVEILATLIAALIHDYEHTGTTNNFHVMSGSETALLYNDRAVLENHHVCAAFRLLRGEENNVLTNLSREEYREFRTLVIEMVLATDMSSHFQQIKSMKTMLSLSDSRQAESLDKAKALSLVLHCCDISHPAKRWDLHEHWTRQLLEEFFRQGDKERDLGLPYSPLCDRNNTLVAESQIGFIDFIVEPSLQVCVDLLEKVSMITSSGAPTTTIVEESQNATVSVAPSTETILEEETDNEPGGPIKRPVRSSGAVVPRPWQQCLVVNKARWKDRAAKDAEARALQAQQLAEINGDESSDEEEEENAQEDQDKEADSEGTASAQQKQE